MGQQSPSYYHLKACYAHFEVVYVRGWPTLTGSPPQWGVHFQKPQCLSRYWLGHTSWIALWHWERLREGERDRWKGKENNFNWAIPEPPEWAALLSVCAKCRFLWRYGATFSTHNSALKLLPHSKVNESRRYMIDQLGVEGRISFFQSSPAVGLDSYSCVVLTSTLTYTGYR